MKRKTLLVCFLLAALTLGLTACSAKEPAEPRIDFTTGISEICNLTTLECYYHNVAAMSEDTKFIGFIPSGTKQLWISYSGIVKIGIDASKVTISDPDASGTVTVTIPQAEVLSVDVDEDSMIEYVQDAFANHITLEEKTETLATTQSMMEEDAKNNDKLLQQGRNRAKLIISKYIENIGSMYGKTFSVKWVDVK